MAITKIQSESLNLSDNYDFTGTVTGAGGDNKPVFSAYRSSNQLISDATITKVQFNTEIYDGQNTYDNSTNYRFTPNSTGYYLINAGISIHCNENTLIDNYMSIYENGSQISITENYNNSSSKSTWGQHSISIIVHSDNTSDYYELYSYADPTAGSVTFAGNSTKQFTYFNASKIIL